VTSAQTRSSSQSFFDDLGQAVQANPVPAALIGMGALWMLMGGGRTTAAAALLSGGASRLADTLAPAASAVGSGASRLAGGVSDLASSAKESVSELASSATSMAGQAFQTASDTAADTAKRLSSTVADAGSRVGEEAGSFGSSMTSGMTGLAGSVQGNLAETFQRQPLLLGAIGLAIGAALAGAFPKTRFEEELIGEQAGAAKETVETFVSEQAENLGSMANRAVDAVKLEAEAQGLTASALKEGVAAIGKKAATAAKGTRRNGQQSAS
jgi:hypothetical protein